jgi:hypothetical protein
VNKCNKRTGHKVLIFYVPAAVAAADDNDGIDDKYLVISTNHEASHYVLSCSHLLLPPS